MEQVNEFRLADLTVGQQVCTPPPPQGAIVITDEMVAMFTAISGDISPIHVSEQFAQERGFNDRVVYGMLTASFYSTLVGVYLPGKYCVFQECAVSFHKPVYVGDSLHITGKITEIHTEFKRITIKAEIRNQRNERVSKATLIVGVTE
jgi:acyl dehydratase